MALRRRVMASEAGVLALAAGALAGALGCGSIADPSVSPAAGAPPAPRPVEAPRGSIEVLSSFTLPRGMTLPGGAPFGGLSGVAWDAAGGEYWAISDDPSERAPARVVRFRLDPEAGGAASDGRHAAAQFRLTGTVTLRGPDGQPFAADTIDGEGIALAEGGFFVASEGNARRGVAPFVAEFDRDGSWRRALPLPERFLPFADGAAGRGISHNEGPEALARSIDGRFLLAGFEGALLTEGPKAAPGVGAFARLRRYDLSAAGGAAAAEFFYPLDPVSRPTPSAGGLQLNGLVELLPIGGEEYLALEREFVFGAGYRVRLHAVSLAGATDVADREGPPDATVVPARKRLVADFADLGVPLTNYEALVLGPQLADGRRLLLVVADDNFAQYGEETVVLCLALDLALEPSRAPRVANLQGAAHRSPWEGRHVLGLEGVVTAVDRGDRSGGFWIESAAADRDADEATSEGVFVAAPAPAVRVGDRVRLQGRVEEVATGGGLPVTRVALRSLDVVAAGTPLEPPVGLWRAGGARAAVPDRIDDDALAVFDPRDDAIDFWESLEGMRVEVPPGTVVGPRNGFGEVTVLPDPAAARVERTSAGGMVLRSVDDGAGGRVAAPYLDRAVLGSRLARIPRASVGDRLLDPVVGVVDASFSNYKVWALVAPRIQPIVERCGEGRDAGGWRDEATRLTLGTFNVENLTVAGPAERFAGLAATIVDGMGAPAVLALQEVQDDSGPQKDADGVVSSVRTLAALTAAVVAAGGPAYEPVWIDPELDREGGQPRGNIRVAFLFDPRRVQFARRGAAGPLDEAVLEIGPDGARLRHNPARVAPRSAAFTLETGEGVRRSLAAEFLFAGHPVLVINNHWSSKFEDDRPFGARQPPRQPTGARRMAQARELRRFVDAALALDPRMRLAVLGDFNDLEWAAPVAEFARPPLAHLLHAVPVADRYSFNFEGSAQLLDHVVVAPALRAGAEARFAHRNADCDDDLRSSDHDPIVVRFAPFETRARSAAEPASSFP